MTLSQTWADSLQTQHILARVAIEIVTTDLDGMVVDFTQIKQAVKEKLDHRNLNEVLPFNPTAENIARWVCKQIPQCYKVEVQESEANTVIYEKD